MEKKEGVHFSAVREIKFLRELSHPNVVQVNLFQFFKIKIQIQIFDHKIVFGLDS